MKAVVDGNDQRGKEGGIIGIPDDQLIAVTKGEPGFMDFSHRYITIEDHKVHTPQIALDMIIAEFAFNTEARFKQRKFLLDDCTAGLLIVDVILAAGI
jgi:hypothetical protein